MKRPAFQFYPADWRKDPSLSTCSLAARGLWIELMCIMHEATPYGVLAVNSKPMTDVQIGRAVGEPVGAVQELLHELESSGVFSRDEDGAIFSRRMLRDEEFRNQRASYGALGGNPKLARHYNQQGHLYAAQRASDGAVKIGIAVNVQNRLSKLRQKMRGDTLELLAFLPVEDMGAAEAAAHAAMADARLHDEWFALTAEHLRTLGFTLKGVPKGMPKGLPEGVPDGTPLAHVLAPLNSRVNGGGVAWPHQMAPECAIDDTTLKGVPKGMPTPSSSSSSSSSYSKQQQHHRTSAMEHQPVADGGGEAVEPVVEAAAHEPAQTAQRGGKKAGWAADGVQPYLPNARQMARLAYSSEFEGWWAIYPRKAGKLAAFRAYGAAKRMLGADAATRLLEGAATYAAATKGKDERFVAHPATWLNQGRWDDAASPNSSGPAGRDAFGVGG